MLHFVPSHDFMTVIIVYSFELMEVPLEVSRVMTRRICKPCLPLLNVTARFPFHILHALSSNSIEYLFYPSRYVISTSAGPMRRSCKPCLRSPPSVVMNLDYLTINVLSTDTIYRLQLLLSGCQRSWCLITNRRLLMSALALLIPLCQRSFRLSNHL
jgi:hypothetical protein